MTELDIPKWNRERDRDDARASSVRVKAGRRKDVGRLSSLRFMISHGRTDLEAEYQQALRWAAEASDDEAGTESASE